MDFDSTATAHVARVREAHFEETGVEDLYSPVRAACEVPSDMDEVDVAEEFELPWADVSSEELGVQVLPVQRDEFICARCFLVHHVSQLVTTDGQRVCADCAT